PLGLPAEMAALGIVEMVDETMANAARVHAIESGKTYEGRTLIAFGGGGPVHACRLAEKLGISRILVPSGAGVGSAIGFLRAPVAYELVRSLYQRLSSFDVGAVNALLAGMSAEAAAVVVAGSFGAQVSETRTAFMRYVGQGHEIPVPLPARALGADDVAGLRAAYDSEYARFYDRPVPGSDIEVLSFSVIVSTLPEELPPPPASVPNGAVAVPAYVQSVRDTATGEVADWAVYPRVALRPGSRVIGPAIIAEDETSTLVGPGWTASLDGAGYLALVQEVL
ncbi:MAG TPA: hydantoinase/oxoprolinase family protein, partial [Acetobacteraceae bacterium]|nr:hydantoinase/oxoprolinase family protein [Acetobacteraceae bacterium]